MPDPYQNTDAGRHKRAAEGHFKALHELYEGKHYPLTFYVAGLAVETLFRAYIYRVSDEVTKGHGLRELAEEGNFFNYVPIGDKDRISAALGEVTIRWGNLFRYHSEDSLRKALNERGLYRREGRRSLQGNVVVYNSQIVVESASEILSVGLSRWSFSKS